MKENDIQPIKSPLPSMLFYYTQIHSHTSKPRASEKNYNHRVANMCQARHFIYTISGFLPNSPVRVTFYPYFRNGEINTR